MTRFRSFPSTLSGSCSRRRQGTMVFLAATVISLISGVLASERAGIEPWFSGTEFTKTDALEVPDVGGGNSKEAVPPVLEFDAHFDFQKKVQSFTPKPTAVWREGTGRPPGKVLERADETTSITCPDIRKPIDPAAFELWSRLSLFELAQGLTPPPGANGINLLFPEWPEAPDPLDGELVSTPEPGAGLLCIAGALVLLLRRRRPTA